MTLSGPVAHTISGSDGSTLFYRRLYTLAGRRTGCPQAPTVFEATGTRGWQPCRSSRLPGPTRCVGACRYAVALLYGKIYSEISHESLSPPPAAHAPPSRRIGGWVCCCLVSHPGQRPRAVRHVGSAHTLV
jgi:hypothetical protein